MRYLLISLCILLLKAPLAFSHIIVGHPYFKPPFVNLDDGFDLDLMRMVCTRLNEECEFKPMMFSYLFDSLQRKEIDLAVGGITISELREARYLFSFPYALSSGQFLLLTSSGVKSINELYNNKIGVINGSALVDFLVDQYGDKFQLELFDDPIAVIEGLNNKQIKAAFLEEPVAIYWDQHDGGAFMRIDKPIPVGHGYGIMALPENTELIKKINKVLLQMEQDGTYLQLYNTYFSDLK